MACVRSCEEGPISMNEHRLRVPLIDLGSNFSSDLTSCLTMLGPLS